MTTRDTAGTPPAGDQAGLFTPAHQQHPQPAGHGPASGYPYPGYPQPGQPASPQPPAPPTGPAGPGQPARPQPPAHRWGFGTFLLAEAVFVLASFLVVVPFVLIDPSIGEPDAPLPGHVLLVSLVLPATLAGVVGLLLTRLRGNGPIRDLRLRVSWRDVGIGVACGVSGVVVSIPLGMLWTSWVGEDNANSAVGELLSNVRMHPVLAVLVFLNVWLLAPFWEEVLYRGLLWGAMERRQWNRWLILAVTTMVFAVAHFELLRTPLLLAIGLPMGLARLVTGRLPAAVIAHQINNFLPAIGLMLLLLGVPLTE